MPQKNIYIALSNILEAVQTNSELGSLDRESRSILNYLASQQAEAKEICITEITNNNKICGSPVTKFKRIHKLKDDGWITFSHSVFHGRRISISLSPKSEKEILNMSDTVLFNIRELLKIKL